MQILFLGLIYQVSYWVHILFQIRWISSIWEHTNYFFFTFV